MLMQLKAPLGLAGTRVLEGAHPHKKAMRYCLSLGLVQREGQVAFKAVLDLCNAVCAQDLPVQFFKMSRADCEKTYGNLVMGRPNEVPPSADEIVLVHVPGMCR